MATKIVRILVESPKQGTADAGGTCKGKSRPGGLLSETTKPCSYALTEAAFARAFRRALYRLAVFLCTTPFCTALSSTETVLR